MGVFSLYVSTVVGPNKGITKVFENGSNKGFSPYESLFNQIITPDKHKPTL